MQCMSTVNKQQRSASKKPSKGHLEALVQSSVLSGRGQVGDGVGVGPPLGNGGFRWIVGSVVVDVGDGADEAVWVTQVRHADLLSRHEL